MERHDTVGERKMIGKDVPFIDAAIAINVFQKNHARERRIPFFLRAVRVVTVLHHKHPTKVVERNLDGVHH